MPGDQRKKEARSKSIRVVAERRETLDRDMLSVALFGWIVDRLRQEKETRPRQSVDTPEQPQRDGAA